ncbi:segregation and condensation protein A [Lentilactobacillus hilgardii]|jgi:segregation and condensation protein A|uniref:Segregation and condensation protein A n=1 Tax=Lentilactobacillus hilgardii TaxID=1588 RepID=A0A6P1E8Q8_LENHI|nr:segregation/condensation protein A [Lentilactobacillus hilgardii]EEI70024.1 ScpA/B protein [Lentilactobacillus hilgardii ATCC 27305]MCT3391865.1 ribulose phosphate epimerase [Lentilactobacillus hilgardii]QHB52035.1 segregation/condensation protein A [Lentilactobacillus hilgardii]RRG11445.1 MAG: ribulose phosphate epimerase [Lactobacillus sp.]
MNVSDKEPELHLNDFDGPLEVLLHLIQESKMDIYDIPIAEITKQYMDYIYDAQQLNLDIVGDFFVMAAKLMVIKSKMLLPTVVDEATDEVEEDPREDLVNQLINYKRYKLIAGKLKDYENKRRQSFTRSELAVSASKETLTVPSPFDKGDIMASYVDALKHFRYNQPLSTTVHEWQFTIESQTALVRQLLDCRTEQISFNHVIQHSTKPEEIVTDFLAILEMAKYNEVRLKQKNRHETIEIRKGPAYGSK